MTATCHILGASGTIGSAIADRLTDRGEWTVRRWDSTTCDLLDDDAVRATFAERPATDHPLSGDQDVSGDRYVFCAARTRGRGETDDDGAANRRMLDHLLRALDGRCGHLVFLSSVDVYGRPPDGVVLDEGSPLAPDGPYAASKVWCEERLRRDAVPFPVTIFRLPGVYGPGDALRSTAGTLSRKIMAGEPIELPPRPTLRDWVDIADVAALTEAALRPSSAGSRIVGTYVVATGQSLPLREIVGLLARGLERPAVLRECSRVSPRDVDLRFAPRRLRAAFDGVALKPMRDGLVRYGEWARRTGIPHDREPRHGMNQK